VFLVVDPPQEALRVNGADACFGRWHPGRAQRGHGRAPAAAVSSRSRHGKKLYRNRLEEDYMP
jgi:hypothetical protein